MSPRGGKREGAGRPKGSVNLPPGASVGVYLDGATQRALADVLYNGESRAAAIREAIGLLVAARRAQCRPRPVGGPGAPEVYAEIDEDEIDEDEIDEMANDGRLTALAQHIAIDAGADWPSLNGEAQDAWHERAIERIRASGRGGRRWWILRGVARGCEIADSIV